MWAVDPIAGTRRALFCSIEAAGQHPGSLASSEFLAPRGSITTMLLRGYCSDIFIHGLGGAKYDPFVDALAKQYLRVALPRFVVASRTQTLFPKEALNYEDALALRDQYKIDSKYPLIKSA